MFADDGASRGQPLEKHARRVVERRHVRDVNLERRLFVFQRRPTRTFQTPQVTNRQRAANRYVIAAAPAHPADASHLTTGDASVAPAVHCDGELHPWRGNSHGRAF
jgi:hypothetical protein